MAIVAQDFFPDRHRLVVNSTVWHTDQITSNKQDYRENIFPTSIIFMHSVETGRGFLYI